MLLLESLPTVIGTAAVAPALLFLWLVIATDERPGAPLRGVSGVRPWRPARAVVGAAAGALAPARPPGPAVAPNGHNRDWAGIPGWALVLRGPMGLHAAFDFPLLMLQQNPALIGRPHV